MTPQIAFAAPTWWTFYNQSTSQNAVKTSQHWTSLSGGKAGPSSGSTPGAYNVYYVSSKQASGALIVKAEATGNAVTIMHSARSNARSECYWNRFIEGVPVSGGTASLQCQSYRG
ncbi:hypothetical protein ACFQRL_14265 [Microbacterium fluvii]|uniref:Uncharacterized protein n=1 Tax=Microbacterium fluvii TaxID=415215 RepID=A0ABW2HJV3_9MICO|nr:hypothetical protein [Microbacterium fluvii]MCU4673755.1 hypothetical protein [Microbacterium fluvii]